MWKVCDVKDRELFYRPNAAAAVYLNKVPRFKLFSNKLSGLVWSVS